MQSLYLNHIGFKVFCKPRSGGATPKIFFLPVRLWRTTPLRFQREKFCLVELMGFEPTASTLPV